MFKFVDSIKNVFVPRKDQYIFAEMQIPQEGFFTQAELDQLKCIVGQAIQIEERIRSNEKENRKIALNKDDKTYWYKQMQKSNKRIKLLANLQRKIKYSLITMG